MTDRLKLSDLKGDAKADDVAHMLVAEDARKRIEELERNIAVLEKQAAERKGKPVTPLSRNKPPLGARKDGTFKAISMAPSINKTPRGSAMVPVAYATVQDLSNSIGVAKTVRFNGDPVYLLDSSTQPSCQGDEAGTGGGVRSGTVNGEVKPTTGSRSVRVEGKSVVRVGDRCTMNGGNNPGVYIATVSANFSPPLSAVLTSNPAWMPSTPNEHTWLGRILEEVGAALRNPIEGLTGAAKGIANIPPEIAEVLMKGAALKKAADMEESAVLHEQFGNTAAAGARTQVADSLRRVSTELVLPKFAMNNAAQQGGNVIATILQIVTPSGLLKAGQKIFLKLPRLPTFLKPGRNSLPSLQHKVTSMPDADGVSIVSALKATTRREKIEKLREEYALEVAEVTTFKPKVT